MISPPHAHVWYSLMASLFVRLQRLEESLKDEPEEQKSEKRAQHAVKETEFLRLKRSKISVEDFDPIKVIGRGAFGEVRYCQLKSHLTDSLEVRDLKAQYFDMPLSKKQQRSTAVNNHATI